MIRALQAWRKSRSLVFGDSEVDTEGRINYPRNKLRTFPVSRYMKFPQISSSINKKQSTLKQAIMECQNDHKSSQKETLKIKRSYL